MKVLYLECNMGAAGDMLMAALYELLEDKTYFLETMNGILPGITITPHRTSTCGISGTRMEVAICGEEEESLDGNFHIMTHTHDLHHDQKHSHIHEHSHVHRKMEEISEILAGMDLPEQVKVNAKSIYDRIAEAEAKAHGVPVKEIHFHEVGNLDAITDVVGVCLAMHMLSPEKIIASPIHMGSGQVKCAHGIVSVPAPATANLLKGVPCYSGEIHGELCTPTGAALVVHFAEQFGSIPVMTLEGTGYGIGKKEFPVANCVRAFWGESKDSQRMEIVELCCHIDDMTAEALAFAGERLLDKGALDISTSPITMKKGRSGTAFTVLCRPIDEERIAREILFETNTNGLRIRKCKKYILTPAIREIKTSYGTVRIKCAEGMGIYREKPEYEDVAFIARREGLPFSQVWKDILVQMKESEKE